MRHQLPDLHEIGGYISKITMKHRNSTESGWVSLALLFVLCCIPVFLVYTTFWSTNGPRDLGISALIVLGLLLVGVPGVFICMIIAAEWSKRAKKKTDSTT